MFLQLTGSNLRSYRIFLQIPFAALLMLLSAIAGCVSLPDQSLRNTVGASQVEILFPAPDALLEVSTVEISFRFLKGRKDGGEHLHLYLDGKKWGNVKNSPVTLHRLAPGPHTVLLEIVNKDHLSVAKGAEVHFKVR